MSDADRIAQLEAENKAMREALEWYGNAELASGERARKVLATLSTTASKGGGDE